MFSSKKKYETFDFTVFELPAISVSASGQILACNDHFLKSLKFTKDEVVGQNVHILIPPKFMKKSNHEKLVSRYTYGKPSAIIGSVRTMPVKNADDEDLFLNIQILPYQTGEKKTEFKFLCFFHEIPVNRAFDIDKKRELVLECLQRVEGDETFRMDSEGVRDICSALKLYLNWEINLLVNFIYQNKQNKALAGMIRYFVLSAPLGHIANVRQFFTKKFQESEIAFLNALALRILFPILINNFKGIGTVLEGLKEQLYRDHLDDNSLSGSSNSRAQQK